MKISSTTHVFALAFWLGLISTYTLPVPIASGYEYKAIQIQPLPGRQVSRAMGINNQRQVVGRSYNVNASTGEALDRQAFIWDMSSGARPFPTLSGESSAWDINDNGLVSGYSYNASAKQRAVLWDSVVNSILDIGTLRNPSTGIRGDSSTAYNLNNSNLVVGSADIPNNEGNFVPFHGFIYDRTSGIRDLGTFTNQHPEWQNGYSIAYDINKNGEIVGIAHDDSWAFLPFIYNETNGMQALQRASTYLTGEWYAVAINDSGLIGGHVIAATNQSFPYYWPSKSSTPVKITMPAGFPYGEIYGINASGQMVGIMWSSDQAGATEHAFVFDAQKGVRDLNSLIETASGWVLHFARDINDKGDIAGYGEFNGQKRGFFLESVCDLSIAWNQTPQPAVAGEAIRYTVTLANAGPGSASNVILVGTMPNEVTDLVYSINGVGWQGYTGAIQVGEIVAGGTSQVVIEGTVTSWASDPFVPSLSASSTTTDANQANNAAEIETFVTSEADLSLSIESVPQRIGINQELRYTAVVWNEGPSDSKNVVLKLEGADWFASSRYSIDGGMTWMDWTGPLNLGTVSASESVEVMLKGMVMPVTGSTVKSTVSLESATADTDGENNAMIGEVKLIKGQPWLILLLQDD